MSKDAFQSRFKNKKSVSFLALCTGALLWHHFSVSYFNIIPITFGKYNYPYITTKLQNQSCELAIDVGCRFPLALNQKVLEKIPDKQLLDAITVRNIEGKISEVPAYLIPQLKIGGLALKNIITHQSEEEYGTLGKFLGGTFNLLLDFPHSRIVACNSFSKLKNKNITKKDWVAIPIEMHRAGIVFHVETDFGMRKLAINTTSTFNVLNSSLIAKEMPFVSSSFILGENHFGNVTFESIHLPEGLSDIDGFIGMDFLKEHAIYIDYTHNLAYIEPPKRYFQPIPVTFDSHNKPVIDVSIEGSTYSLDLDLGSGFALSLSNEVLQNIAKAKRGSATWHDFKGRQYESSIYTVPEIKIKNLKLTQVYTKQKNEDFHINVTVEGEPLQPTGVIGLPILEKYNLFLDFPHSTIYASKDHLLLQEAGLLSHNLLAVPFTLHPDGILLPIETDNGTYKLMLDTGSTTTAIRAPHPSNSAQFRIMGHNFGECSIDEFDLCTRFEFEGVLGMDFLCKHPTFIDYSNKIVYIDLDTSRQKLDH